MGKCMELVNRVTFVVVKVCGDYIYAETGRTHGKGELRRKVIPTSDFLDLGSGLYAGTELGDVYLTGNLTNIMSPISIGIEYSFIEYVLTGNGHPPYHLILLRDEKETVIDHIFADRLKRPNLIGRIMSYRPSADQFLTSDIIRTGIYNDLLFTYHIPKQRNAQVMIHQMPDSITEEFCNWLLELDAIKEMVDSIEGGNNNE